MEEAREHSVVNEPSFIDWSARHTRLRYQTVLLSLVFLLISRYDISSFSILGFIEFDGTPKKIIVLIGILSFAMYSAVSFILQHDMEKRTLKMSSSSLRSALSRMLSPFASDDSQYQSTIGSLIGTFERLQEERSSKKISGGIRQDDVNFIRSHIKQLTADLEYIRSMDHFDSEIRKIFPARDSGYYNFSEYRKSVIDRHQKFTDRIAKLVSGKYANLQFGDKNLNDLLTSAGSLLNAGFYLGKGVSGIQEDIETYLSRRKYHSELLPFKLPLLVAGGFILAGFLLLRFP